MINFKDLMLPLGIDTRAKIAHEFAGYVAQHKYTKFKDLMEDPSICYDMVDVLDLLASVEYLENTINKDTIRDAISNKYDFKTLLVKISIGQIKEVLRSNLNMTLYVCAKNYYNEQYANLTKNTNSTDIHKCILYAIKDLNEHDCLSTVEDKVSRYMFEHNLIDTKLYCKRKEYHYEEIISLEYDKELMTKVETCFKKSNHTLREVIELTLNDYCTYNRADYYRSAIHLYPYVNDCIFYGGVNDAKSLKDLLLAGAKEYSRTLILNNTYSLLYNCAISYIEQDRYLVEDLKRAKPSEFSAHMKILIKDCSTNTKCNDFCRDVVNMLDIIRPVH